MNSPSWVWWILGCAFVVGCAARSNKLEYDRLSSAKLGKEMELSVLRAPRVPGIDPGELPVVVLLHGRGDDHRSLDRFGLSDLLHEAMLAGRIPLAHFIMPHGEKGFYVNWYDGSRPYEDYILQEVIPRGERLLGVAPNREKRHILGVSMGASGAINIGLRHPDLFSSISSLSGLIMNREQADALRERPIVRLLIDVEQIWGDGTDEEFSNSLNPYLLVQKRPGEYVQKLFIAYGSDEGQVYEDTAGKFHSFLDEKGLEHQFVIYDGGHGWRHWAPVIEDALIYVLEREEGN